MTIDTRPLASVFARYPVVAAYLFGSQATGTATALSDVDFAVVLEPGVSASGDVQAALISDLMLVLRRSDIDVVILNAAPPLLKERAISRGRLVYCRDDVARVRFEVAARREYFDTQPLRAAQDQALLDRYTAER
ncbi:MAG TPA: nucleotidyltransferase domain-containing protein [Candidatus Binatia bacterium]